MTWTPTVNSCKLITIVNIEMNYQSNEVIATETTNPVINRQLFYIKITSTEHISEYFSIFVSLDVYTLELICIRLCIVVHLWQNIIICTEMN